MIEPIEIPDATREPAAYVRALVRTLGEREPLEVLRGTPATARELWGLRAANLAMLEGVTDADRDRLGVHGEQGEERFELALAKVAGHDLAHLDQLARTVAAVRG